MPQKAWEFQIIVRSSRFLHHCRKEKAGIGSNPIIWQPDQKGKTGRKLFPACLIYVVEMMGFEPTTPTLRTAQVIGNRRQAITVNERLNWAYTTFKES